MKTVYIYWFRSESYDDYFMKSLEKNYFSAEKFCKEKINYEYEAWDEDEFTYNTFKVFTTTEDGFVKINRSFGEYWKVVPADMKEYDVAYFTDSYCPKTYDRYGEEL